MADMKKILEMQFKKMKLKKENGKYKVSKEQFKQANDEIKRRHRKIKESRLNKMDQEKLSTKAKRLGNKVSDHIEDAIDENFQDLMSEVQEKGYADAIDRLAGRSYEKRKESIVNSAKNIKERYQKGKDWIKNNKGKLAVGGAVAGAGAYAYDKHEKDKTISRIKKKPASERTAQEKRLLRLMQEEDE